MANESSLSLYGSSNSNGESVTQVRRATWTRMGKASGVKIPSRLGIMLRCDDLKRCTALARQAETQQSALSFFWSVDSLAFVGPSEFDVAIVVSSMWPEARRAIHLSGMQPMPIVVLGAEREGLISSDDYQAPVLALPEPAAPDLVLGAAIDLALRYQQELSEPQLGELAPSGSVEPEASV